jgi:hypothetical protein
MLASRDLPAALVELIYMRPSEDEEQLIGYDIQLLALWNHQWHWIAHDFKNEILFSSASLRETAKKMASEAPPFEYAHMIVITSTEGFEEETPWDLFPIEQVFEEVGSLFERTPKFVMEFGTREFSVIPVTTWSPRYFLSGDEQSQTHLLYIEKDLGKFDEHLVYVNMTMDDDALDSDRWDKVEIGMLCGNEIVVGQIYRGTAQLLSDSRIPADFHRDEMISLDEARRFIELVATSVEREGETFVDLWGRSVLTPIGHQVLAGHEQ